MTTAAPLIALAGNPNTGKTTLFNALTGLNARIGNYPGITVDRTVGRMSLGPNGDRPVDVADVPGAYSLAGRSPEEQLAIDAIIGRHDHVRPDLVVLVLDGTNLERNLYLAMQVLELDVPVVAAVNMMDAARGAGTIIDIDALTEALGVPVTGVSAQSGEGIQALRAQILTALDAAPRPSIGWRWSPSAALAADLDALVPHLGAERPEGASDEAARALALATLMSVDLEDELVDVPAALRLRVLGVQRAAKEAGRDLDGEIVAARFQWIDEVSPRFVRRDRRAGATMSERVDRVLTHPIWGFTAFIGVMFLVFQSLFAWADPAIGVIEDVFATIAGVARSALPEGILSDFVANGLIAGVGSVLVFLPQILLLFVFIAIMEDSGYMARAAFLMDRIMNKIGLNGRAFVPMLSGYACAVPAIMATRTMERQRDRYLTMMAVPLMTCSARLPVYTLVIASLFPAAEVLGIFPTQGLLMVGMYVFGTIMALISAAVIGRTVLKGRPEPLLLELPDYRRPSAKSVGRLAWSRARVFVREAGTVILACTVVLWALLYFPRESEAVHALEVQRAAVLEANEATAVLDQEIDSERLRQSFAGRLGRSIEPALAPLGFDWKIGVGLIGAFAAREVFISTMGVVYGVGHEVDEANTTLRARMRAERRRDGSLVYTPLVGLSLLVFFSIACQCMSTLAVVKRETRSYRWPVFMFAYMSALAWICAFAVYQGGRLLGFA